MADWTIAERILSTYTFEEVLEMNELTEEDVLSALIDQEMITVEPMPL
jgi:hypothetical protein